MSGAQPKAGNIAGCVSITAEINPKATHPRYSQGWVDEVIDDLDVLMKRVRQAKADKQVVSIAYQGNVVDLWERLAEEDIVVELGSDQTSLHNPWAGGYYPVGLSFEESKQMMAEQPELFKEKVQESLRRHVAAINKCVERECIFIGVFPCRCRYPEAERRLQVSFLCSGYYGTDVFRLRFRSFPLGMYQR